MKSIRHPSVPAVFAAAFLSACAGSGHNGASFQSYTGSNVDDSGYGRVEAIQVSKIPGSDDVGVGSVIGGLLGGLLANQVGGGSGKLVATAAGVGSGAVAGNHIEQKTRPHEIFTIRVQLDSGAYQTISQDNDTDLNIGNRVHIDNGRVYRY